MSYWKFPLLLLAAISIGYSDIFINEIGASNDSYFNEIDSSTPDWIELYNSSSNTVDLTGYYLSDNELNHSLYAFPGGTQISPKGFLRLWISDETTGFKLSKSGETLLLTDSNGSIVDSTTFGEQVTDISYGRYPDGSSIFLYFEEITPGAENSDSTYDQNVVEVLFSIEPGFYSSAQTVLLSSETGKIYYTTDGSIPTENSSQATGPISITETTLIKAVALGDEIATQKVYTKTYFIDEEFHTLPVFSISASPDIVEAMYNDFGANGSSVEETLGYVEMFTASGERVLSQKAGVKPFGRGSNINKQKSLALYSRDSYGKKYFKHPLFPNKNIEKTKRFVLRNSGNDNKWTLFRDAVIQQIVKDQMDVDYQDYQPSIVFVNGEYHGIQNIREKADKFYPKSNYGVDDDTLDMISGAIGGKAMEILAGTTTNLFNLDQYMTSNDLSKSSVYSTVQGEIDILNFIDYQITQYYIGNRDWASNVKQWRPIGSGKWRWILYDTDYGAIEPETDFFTTAHGSSFYPAWEQNLLTNDNYRSLYLQRFAAHIALTFDYERVVPFIDSCKSRIEPLMDDHINRWSDGIVSQSGWNNSINELKSFFENRSEHIFSHIEQKYNTTGTVTLTVQNQNSQAGTITIAGVPVQSDTVSGYFFKDIPVAIKAVANEGYVFTGWSNGASDSVLTIVPSADTVIEALFEADTNSVSLVKTAVRKPVMISTSGNRIHIANLASLENGNSPRIVRVYDLRGRELIRQRISADMDNYSLPVKQVSSGIYVLNITGSTRTLTKKITIGR